MNRRSITLMALTLLMLFTLNTLASEAPKMKMTTKIPAAITIPDRVESRIGTLTFEDGFPTEETAQTIYDQLDFQRAVESVMMTTPAASETETRLLIARLTNHKNEEI